MNSNLQVSQAVVWQETCYVIKAIKPTLGDIVLEAKGGVERAVDIRAFYNLIASGEIELSQRQIEATQRSWTVSEQREADFRQQLLEFQRSLEKQGLDPSICDAQIDRYCQRHGHKRPSNKTIQRYRKDLKRLGFEGLIPNFSRRGGTGWAKKTAAKAVAEKVLIQTFMKDDKVNLSSVALMVNEELKMLNQATGADEKVDRKTIARLLQQLPSSLVKQGRLDPRTYNLWNRQAVRRYDVKLPFERVEIDAKTIDVYCCDEYGHRYTELTLYAMVCARTSYPVGVFVSGGKPSEYTLLKVFEFFLMPKDPAFNARFAACTHRVRRGQAPGVYFRGEPCDVSLALCGGGRCRRAFGKQVDLVDQVAQNQRRVGARSARYPRGQPAWRSVVRRRLDQCRLRSVVRLGPRPITGVG